MSFPIPDFPEVIVLPVPGIPGPPGPSGGTSFSFVQITPAATWTVTHTLTRRPFSAQVTVGTEVVITDCDYPDTSTAVITFASPTAGRLDLL